MEKNVNLYRDDLYKSFRENLNYAFDHTQCYANIVFKFGIVDDFFKSEFKVSLAGCFKINDVLLSPLSIQQQIDVIIANMHYNGFAFIDKDVHHGPVVCNGHNDYVSTSRFVFNYLRLKQDDNA